MSSPIRAAESSEQYVLDFCTAADEALRDEIAAVRRSERREALPVFGGQRLERDDAAGVQYVFRTDQRASRLQVGERVRYIPTGVPPVEATVVARTRARLTLELSIDLGPSIPEGVVQRDAAWLQQALRDGVSVLARALQTGDPAGPIVPASAAAVLRRPNDTANAGCPVLACPPELLEGADGLALNEDQLRAAESVLTRPVTWIWGPPGTGKSTTLAAAVSALVQHGRRVLVVAPSNVSADVFLAALHPWMQEHPLIARGVVQRVGPRVSSVLPMELRDLFVPATVRQRLEEEYASIDEWIDEERVSGPGVGDAEAIEDLTAAIRAERQNIRAELARNCMVVVTPIANVYLQPELWRSYDVVVIDEASMCAPPAVMLAASLARERVVVGGDFQQLGPVTVGDSRAIRSCLGTDAFWLAGIPELCATEENPPGVVMLRDQMRMPRAVAELVNADYYLGQLRTAHARPPAAPLPHVSGPVVLIDTSALEPTVARGTRANETHARVVAGLIEAISRRGAGGAPADVGVLTLYRDQVDCLNEALARAGSSPAHLVSTVHRAQGSEVGVVVLDLADAPGARVTFLRAARAIDAGGRLLNVGITRAREGVIVVAAVDYLERTAGRMTRQLLARLREQGEVIDAAELLVG